MLKTIGTTLFGSAVLCRLCSGRSARHPNVVFILTNDQGTLEAKCFGSADLHTPAIDKLAANGVRFTQGYAHTVCCPARAMLMTGRHPQRSNVNSWMQGKMRGLKGLNILRSEITIAEALRKVAPRGWRPRMPYQESRLPGLSVAWQ